MAKATSAAKKEAPEKEKRQFTEADRDKMDAAAKVAAAQFAKLKPEIRNAMAKFWATHYVLAGHKRLGRMLAKHAKDNGLVNSAKKDE